MSGSFYIENTQIFGAPHVFERRSRFVDTSIYLRFSGTSRAILMKAKSYKAY